MKREEFDQHVRNAMEMVYDSISLEGHPLSRLLGGIGTDRKQLADGLRCQLLKAIEQLKPPQRVAKYEGEWRRYRHMRLRYLEGLTTAEIADELAISTRQARRDHQEAMEELCNLLWAEHRRQAEARISSRSEETDPDTGAPRHRQPTLEAELMQLGSLPPDGPTDLQEVVRGVRGVVSPLADSRGLLLRVSLPTDLPPVSVNRSALRQALVALLNHAIQTASGDRLDVGGADTPEGVELSLDVGGDGDLVPPGLHSRQVAPSSMLAVSRFLIEMQGGSFRVIQRDRGLRFCLCLPRAQATTVLIIDDNPDSVRLFQRYLSSTNYRVLQANNAEAAIRLARKSRPQVITLDVMMPFQDGWEILRELKRYRETKDIPVIVCSVLQEGALALSLGAAEFLAKPVPPSALLASLQRWAPAPPTRSVPPASNASAPPLAGRKPG